MRQIRVKIPRPDLRHGADPDLRTPSGRTLPY